MATFPDKLSAGRTVPLGATWDGLGTNFAVFSANAERVDLCLFDPGGRREVKHYTLPEQTDEVWHGYLPHAGPGTVYGYRAYGPYEPQRGHRFNPNKLLLDPYARRITGSFKWSDALFGYRVNSPRADLSFDRRDSAPGMWKAIVAHDSFSWGDDKPPNIPWSETVIYEAHLRGLTMLREDLRPHERGTFAALADPAIVSHLQRLGITAVELLPIHAFVQDRHLLAKGLRNYWGYNSLCFFAIEPRYLSEGAADEMRIAVRQLHAAGIEIILDVVYNHTAEGNEHGPTLSFRGLDNANYYRLVADNPRHCINDTGTGNTVNASHPRVLQLIMDSLRYWVTEFHVDGFRFDLGTTLGRETHGFDPGAGFFDAIRQDPTLSRVKLISEPWDLGPGGYQLGRHPPGFAEWNDRFRDTVRRYWRGDAGQRPDLAARLSGSGDLFDHLSRRPWASVNFLAAHDGFTLADLTAYAKKHNDANGENNRDGHAENYSANWGAKGPTDNSAINDKRRRVQRAMLTTILSSLGTPMLLAGDEFGRTQQGNNNAYCQDNELSWLDWSLAETPEGKALIAFIARLTELRRRYPILRSPHFLHGRQELAPGVLDIQWFDSKGKSISAGAWNDPEKRLLALRRAATAKDGAIQLFTLYFNPTNQERPFRIAEPRLPAVILVDSAAPEDPGRDLEGDTLHVAAHSGVLTLASTSPGEQ